MEGSSDGDGGAGTEGCGEELAGASAGWDDADTVSATGANVAAGNRTQVVVETDLNCSEVVIPAAEGETLPGRTGICLRKLRQDLIWRRSGWEVEGGESRGNLNSVDGGASL